MTASRHTHRDPALEGVPRTIVCYDCSRAAGRNVMDDDDCIRVAVVKLGRVVNAADPTQTYVLACGHTVI